jgi:molybdopterin biosynthesis enzyme
MIIKETSDGSISFARRQSSIFSPLPGYPVSTITALSPLIRNDLTYPSFMGMTERDVLRLIVGISNYPSNV